MLKLPNKFNEILKSPIIINSYWGVVSQVLQSILLSLFFVLIARNYSTLIFADFLVATVLYQLVSAFSTLGLSQWFIREITGTEDKNDLINKFLKLQVYSGVAFYLLNIGLGFLLYDSTQIHWLTVLLGVNIVFDNLINAIKCINISEFKQKKSFIIFTAEAFLKFVITCFLFIYPFSIITLSLVLVIVRFVTLNLFLNLGSSQLVNLRTLFKYRISIDYILKILKANWAFIIMGSISIINWRISTVIISKVLNAADVANFEISFKIFSIAQMLPVVVAGSVFPTLIKNYKEGKVQEFNALYRKMHLAYLLFGILSFTFIYSFADFILPYFFGLQYAETAVYTKQMFLTILVFPTAFLQANVLVALKLEKMDMLFNIVSLLVNLMCCIIGLYFFKSLLVINIAIFLGFLLFHIMQDIFLIRKKINTKIHVISVYVVSLIGVGGYVLLAEIFSPFLVFVTFWIVIVISCLLLKRERVSYLKELEGVV